MRKKIKKIVFIETEKTKDTGYKSRGIRCDVYIEDAENTVYDVEMQASRKRHLGKRFRYYQSAIDVDIVTKGESVGKLKTSFIIFITTYDLFSKGLFVYQFDVVCTWDPSIVIGDAARWYVLNTTGTKDATVTDDMLIAVLKIEPKTINNIRFVISQHPDWDDDAAAEVLNSELPIDL